MASRTRIQSGLEGLSRNPRKDVLWEEAKRRRPEGFGSSMRVSGGLFHGEFGRNAKRCREMDEKEQLTPEKQKVASRPCNHSMRVKSAKLDKLA